MAQGPVLVGVSGVVQGTVFPLVYGKSIVVGRSRSCDVSLRNCARWIEAEKAGKNPDKATKTVSRKHVKISYYNANSIEVEDLSSNGTFVDGKRVDRVVLTDLKEKPHNVQMGAGEIFRLEWR